MPSPERPSHDRSAAVSEEVLIEASPETVFEFFVSAAEMRKWMGGHATLDATPGGLFAVDIGGNHARGSFVEVRAAEKVVSPGDGKDQMRSLRAAAPSPSRSRRRNGAPCCG
ncbi:MAG: SRPBCC domain-containing protein [Acidimicrobiia bacterium]|nr:SRPBCC domain-containing protein [Acidimicrobiia bacterium]